MKIKLSQLLSRVSLGLRSLILTSTLVLSAKALALPTLAPEVLQFIHSGQRASATIPVILMYHTDLERVSSYESSQSSVEIQKRMMEHTREQEQEVLGRSQQLRALQATSLWLINGTSLRANRSQLAMLMSEPRIRAIAFGGGKPRLLNEQSDGPSDHELASALNLRSGKFTYGLRKIGVPEMRAKYPDLTGRGVRVGIIDTGIDPHHPDVGGRLKRFRDFISPSNTSARDGHGHGTHVAGTIAGGSASGQAIGVAPEAELVIAKGFSDLGNSEDPDLIRALQWMADPDEDPNTADAVHVVSNSWGSDHDAKNSAPENEPFCVAVDNLMRLGITPVFAAGNEGPSARTILIPGSCPNALTVGATDSSDEIADFSSRGPVQWKSSRHIKPDISAPGVSVTSAYPGGGYSSKSGTSMAAPHVAGAAAILYQARPGISPAAVKAAVMNGALDLGLPGLDPDYGQGRLNLFNALTALPRL